MVPEVAALAARARARHDLRDIERVLYFEAYVSPTRALVNDDKIKRPSSSRGGLLAKIEEHGAIFGEHGGRGIRELLRAINLNEQIDT